MRSTRRTASLRAAIRAAIRAAVLLLLGWGWASPAGAVPSFARQTGEPCTSCHIGAFGPELTGRGRTFKLLGYTEQQYDAPAWWERFSGMVLGSFTSTAKSQAAAPPQYFRSNNNFALDQASIFYGGRLTSNIGAFIQLTEDGVAQRFHLDNVDVRFARAVPIGGLDTILGVSVNNNPGIADPYNTLPAWGHPYASSALAPAPIAGAILNGGLAGQVYGVSAYSEVAGHLYAEAGIYNSLSSNDRHFIGSDPNAPYLATPATFLRLALAQENSKHLYQVGTFAFQAALHTPGAAADRFVDWGMDGSYQFLGNRTHIVTAYARWLHEDQTLNGTFDAGGAGNARQHLTEMRANLSYWFRQTYGATFGVFRTTGSTDAILYVPSPISGSALGRPNTQGVLAELDWTPFGKDDSWHAPWANLKLGLQYVAYSQFNGAGQNYDGYGRNAGNNNTVYLFAWIAF